MKLKLRNKQEGGQLRIGVIGLGKLGLPLALCLAELGYQVNGFDKNHDLVESLGSGAYFTHEPKVMDLFKDKKVQKSISYSISPDTLKKCNLIYIIVPTPSNLAGFFDSKYVEVAIDGLLKTWEQEEDERYIVIVSTVMPGTCKILVQEKLQGRNIKLIYSPEFIALGTVVDNLKNPDAILVGCSEERDAALHVEVQKRLSGNIPVSLLGWDEAEVVKLLVNCYVTMKISFANFIGEICDLLPGARPTQIAKALGIDSRIGIQYLNPGLGYAGPCFPRDNRALSAWSESNGLKADLALATQAINSRQPTMALHRIVKQLKEGSSVLIVGLVYKPRTEVLENSQSLELAKALKTSGFSVSIFDPFISPAQTNLFNSEFEFLPLLSKNQSYNLVILSPGFEYFVNQLSPDQAVYKF